MMHLYLVQHASAKSSEEDANRPLSDEGVSDITRMAEFLARHGSVNPYRIMHSGKLRAQQSAEILAHHLGMDHAELVSDMEPKADPGLWSAHLEAMYEDVMLVGHLPHIGRLASLLLAGNPEQSVALYQPGAVLCLKRKEGTWHVDWMLTPALLASSRKD